MADDCLADVVEAGARTVSLLQLFNLMQGLSSLQADACKFASLIFFV